MKYTSFRIPFVTSAPLNAPCSLLTLALYKLTILPYLLTCWTAMWCCIYFHIECYAMVCFRLSGQHNTAPQRVLGVPELVCCHLVRLQRAIDCFHNIQMVRRQRGSPGFRWLLPPLLHRRLSHCVLWGFIPRQQLRFMQPQYIGASLCWRYEYLFSTLSDISHVSSSIRTACAKKVTPPISLLWCKLH